MLKEISFTRAALKSLRDMPSNMAQRIRSKIEAYAVDPSSQANNVKALSGSATIRLRVGDWRVVMEDGAVLAVLKIGPRGSIYD